MHRPKSLEGVLEEQMRRFELSHAPNRLPEPHRPVVAVSRQHGALGEEVARAVARRLNLSYYDREILSRIAEETHLSERSVSTLDERDERSLLADWLAPLVGAPAHLSPYEYVHTLTRALYAIAGVGGAVILGRGAHLVLRPEQALRVMVVAPLATRVRTVSRHEGIDEVAALQRILQVENERRAFLKRCFQVEAHDPSAFDLQVNTAALGVEGAAMAICAALEARPAVRVRETNRLALQGG
jgi:cytidylate kinase